MRAPRSAPRRTRRSRRHADESAPIDPRRHSPAADRNRGPLLGELRRLLPERGDALEIASGTGQHAAHFAVGLPGWTWQPSDADPDALASIAAWCDGLGNVRPPMLLDVLSAPGADDDERRFDAIFCANLLHISAWPVCAGLMRCAARVLAPDGLLMIYGPFLVEDTPTVPSNQDFDADLRRRNPAWGVRRRVDVTREAAAARLELRQSVAMPANNLLLVLARSS